MKPRWLPLIALVLAVPQVRAAEGDKTAEDPFWVLLHDEAVVAELHLTPAQRQAWHGGLDPLDLRLWPLRNQRGEAAEKELAAILTAAKSSVGKILRPEQAARLEQIVLRARGTAALLLDDVAARLKLTDKQRAEIEKTIAESRAAQVKVREQAASGKQPADKQSLEKAQQELVRLATAERDAVAAILSVEQKRAWLALIGREFDLSKFGNTRYKAPELIGDRAAWLGQPQSLAALRGRVVVLHFFAFGCINCIHNYPSYRKWQGELVGDSVVLVGVHTPETQGEHSIETLKKKIKDESLNFPVLVDNEKANWNAWGNHWWPSVYVIDQQGYLRAYWPGELKWQGRDGEAEIEKRVRELLSARQH